MKMCSKCRQVKQPKDFLRSKWATSGWQSWCRACKNAGSRGYQHSHKGNEVRLKYNQTSTCKFNVRKYRQSPKGRTAVAKALRKYRSTYPDRIKAHTEVRNAIVAGIIVRQPCEVCGSTENIHGHHDDYSKPLEVRWLCPKHHREHHTAERAKEQTWPP